MRNQTLEASSTYNQRLFSPIYKLFDSVTPINKYDLQHMFNMTPAQSDLRLFMASY